MHLTADYSTNQRTSRPNSSTMYTPVTSPTNPVAPPLSTKLPWHGAHLGLYQGSQYSQNPYQGFSQGRQQQQQQNHTPPQIHEDPMYSTPTILALFRRADESKFEQNSVQGHQQQQHKTPQVNKDDIVLMSQPHWQMHMYHQQQSGSQMAGMTGAGSQGPDQGSLLGPQQQHYQMPQVNNERNAYHIQRSQSHWQMHMYHQQKSGPMAGMTGAGNAPVSVPHHQTHQNLQRMIQDSNTGRWLYQGGQIPPGVNTGTGCVPTVQNHQGTVQQYFETKERRQSAAPNPPHPNKFAFLNKPNKTSKVIAKNPPRKAQKSRQFFTKQQVEMLESRFEKNNSIKKAERDEMSKEIGLTSRQIYNWFQNKKTKVRIGKEEKKRLEARNLEEKKETLERIRRVRKMTEEEEKEHEKILELEKNYE